VIDPACEFDAVLFDLDGTLADTAPDLVAALNRLRAELGFPAAFEAPLRPLAGRGALAILEAGLPELDEHQRLAFRDRYLDEYRSACWDSSRPYEGITECLQRIEAAGRVWGVVTNKPGWLAEPLLQQSGWMDRCACLVAGDTVARAKPFPDPVIEACRRLGVEPSRTLLVGDDLRDVQAGREAGVRTIAAAWGYVPSDQRVADWGADLVLDTPRQLADWLRRRWSLAA
jgi:phosphoglycolate phosphatase